jgi:hypothetical protein
MVVLNIFGVIFFLPLFFGVLWRFMENKEILGSIKDEYYMFAGYSILYFVVYLILGFLGLVIPQAFIIPLYLVFYVALQLDRHYLNTGTYDLPERMKEVKLLGK